MDFTKLLTGQKVQASIFISNNRVFKCTVPEWYILKHDVFFYDVASEGKSKWTVINKVFARRLLKVPRLEPLPF